MRRVPHLRPEASALELAANNIANVNTTGYRGQTPSFRSMLVASSTTLKLGPFDVSGHGDGAFAHPAVWLQSRATRSLWLC